MGVLGPDDWASQKTSEFVAIKVPTRNIPERVRGAIRIFPEKKRGNAPGLEMAPPVDLLSRSIFARRIVGVRHLLAGCNVLLHVVWPHGTRRATKSKEGSGSHSCVRDSSLRKGSVGDIYDFGGALCRKVETVKTNTSLREIHLSRRSFLTSGMQLPFSLSSW